MPEQEELKLIVSLDDQASAGLAKLKAAIQELGGGSMATGLDRIRRQSQEMTQAMRALREESERMNPVAAALTRGLGVVAGALGGVVGAVVAVKSLKDFAAAMIELKTASLETGFSLGQIKGATDAWERTGIARGTAIANVKSLTTALFDLTRQNSQVAQDLLAAQKAETRPAMEQLLRRLTGFTKAGDLAGAINVIQEGYNNIIANAIKRGDSEVEQRTAGVEYYRRLRLSPELVLAAQAGIKNLSAEQKKALAEQVDAAIKLQEQWTIVNQRIEVVTQSIQTRLIKATLEWIGKIEEGGDTWEHYVNARLDHAEERLRAVIQMWKTVIDYAKAAPEDVTRRLQAAEEKPTGAQWMADYLRGRRDFSGNQLYPKPIGPQGAGGAGEPLYFSGGGGMNRPNTGGWAADVENRPGIYSEHVEDRRRQVLDSNTEELKRLNDFLAATGGAPAGALGFLGTQEGGLEPGLGGGTGTARSLGGPMGGLPGMGGGSGTPGTSTGGTPGTPTAGAPQWPNPALGNVMPPGFGGGVGGGAGAGGAGIGRQGWLGTIFPGAGGAAGGQPITVPPGWGPGGSGQPWGTTAGGAGAAAGGGDGYPAQDRSNKGIPASIRYNNPGAQWPSAESKRFGQTDVGVIGGGNKIAGFPTPVHGLASNIALLKRRYVGRPIGEAIHEWSGGGRRSVPGYDSKAILTEEIANDPKFWQAMHGAESGRRGGLSPDTIARALEMEKSGSAAAYEKAHPEFAGRGGGGTAAQAPTSPEADANEPAPFRMQGQVSLGGQTFPWASGGGGRGAIPLGTHNINIGTGDIGSVGKRLGSVATVGGLGGTINDPRYPYVPREGIQIHPGSGATLDQLYTAGCFSVPRAQWPAFKAALLAQAEAHPEGLSLQIGRGGQAVIGSRSDLARGGRGGAIDQAGGAAVPHLGAQAELDRATGRELDKRPDVNVNGTGKIEVEVKAPAGTKAGANGDGLFKKTEVTRQVQMEPAAQGPPVNGGEE